MAQSFSDIMAAERDRLAKLLDGVADKIAGLNEEAAGYKLELSAIDAYEMAKAGKALRSATAARSPRGSRQEVLLSLIGGNAAGMSRGEILEALGLKGNKAQEGSISNALNSLKKAGKLTSKDGKYLTA